MGDALSARHDLIEPSLDQDAMHPGEGGRFHSEVNDHIDVVGWSSVVRSVFDLVQEDHLTADEQAVVPQQRRELCGRMPRLPLAASQQR